MQLLTKVIREKLIKNFKQYGQPGYDPIPVVKYFTPDANATWLITDMDPETEIMFGLCDLGVGCPELGTVSLDEMQQFRGPFNLPIERDLYIDLDKPLSFYSKQAFEKRRIAA